MSTQNKNVAVDSANVAQQRSVMDEQQRWKNSAQREEGHQKGLTREQIEAGTATVGYATTHAGHPEEAQTALNTETQPVRIGEAQFQKEHHITKANQIGGENAPSISQEIRANHGLEPKSDACEGCGKNECRGCGSLDANKIGLQKKFMDKKSHDCSDCQSCKKGECKDENCNCQTNVSQKQKTALNKDACLNCKSSDCTDKACAQKGMSKSVCAGCESSDCKEMNCALKDKKKADLPKADLKQ